MWSWLTSPPVLLTGLLASVIGVVQPLARKIVLFPRRCLERELGRLAISLIQSIAAEPSAQKSTPPEDWSRYHAPELPRG